MHTSGRQNKQPQQQQHTTTNNASKWMHLESGAPSTRKQGMPQSGVTFNENTGT